MTSSNAITLVHPPQKVTLLFVLRPKLGVRSAAVTTNHHHSQPTDLVAVFRVLARLRPEGDVGLDDVARQLLGHVGLEHAGLRARKTKRWGDGGGMG